MLLAKTSRRWSHAAGKSHPEASSQLMSPFSPGALAPATAADHSGPAVRRCPACVSPRATTTPIDSQGVVTRANASATVPAVPI